MWRLPVFNLFFVLILITVLTIQHSVSRNRPGEGRLMADYHLDESLTAVEVEPAHEGTLPGDGFGNVTGYLNRLWQRSIIMKQWVLEYETSFWQRMSAPSDVEAALIEARFHVANAEFFGAALGETPRTKVELDRAENYLIAARPLVTDHILPTVESIRQELEAIKTNLPSISSANPERFERIKSDLDHLIKTLRAAKV